MYVRGDQFASFSCEGRSPCRPLPVRERLTGLSAPEDTPDCHVIPKLPVVDTEVDPPQPFSRSNDDQAILAIVKKNPAPPEQIGHFVSAFE